MSWRTYWQRLTFVVLISALVTLLIAIGLDPNLAVSSAATVVLISRDLWMPGKPRGRGRDQVEEGATRDSRETE
ncbi:hypothetical protein [Streptomyces sp. NPDC048224]|uniref:hypothetical protein n=1 Tax=Streptomyces sp. NPDC048224 TaxID=3154500 RepID=UPI0033C4C6D8